jgi:hypothetical protein
MSPNDPRNPTKLQIDLAKAAGFESPLPTIDQFLEMDYFLGHIGKTIYPFWREQLRKIHPSPYYSPYQKILVSGSVGGGKSTACLVSMLYDLAIFLHRTDPHEQYGFTKGQPLYIALINSTLSLSNDVQLKNFFNILDNSPFFQEQRAKAAQDRKPSKGALSLNLPFNIEMLAGSMSRMLVGRAIISGLLSELNIMSREGGKQAVNVFIELSNRLYTRFDRGQGLSAPGKLYLDSSRKEVMGILDQYMELLRSDPKTLIIENSFWNYVKGSDRDTFSGETFKVFKGTPTSDPFVMKPDHEYPDTPEALIVNVPIELSENFRYDTINALRDLAGISTHSTGNFLPVEPISDMLVLKDLQKQDILEIDMYDEADTIRRHIRLDDGQLILGVPYYIHMDLSKNRDRTGIAFTRAAGKREIEHFDPSEGKNRLIEDVVYQTDLLICMRAKPNQQIPLSKIEHFLVELSQLGFYLALTTADQVASAQIIQALMQYGLKAEYLSVDRTRQPYDNLRQVCMERRIKTPNHWVLEKELKELLDFGDYIDHPEETALNKAEDVRPSKDLTDAVAGSVWNCAQAHLGNKSIIAFQQFADAIEAATVKEPPHMTYLNDAWSKAKKSKNSLKGWDVYR